ncbi:hypothetical protein KJ865_12525, partial [Myxococcota bacterium]|nr:hypothetical protein [Myxococcota bacterium]
MRLSFTLIESTLVGTVHSSGGVQRHRMAYRPQEAIALTREILGTLQEGVRLGAKASAAEPALKLLGSRLARTIMSEQLLLLLAGAEGEYVPAGRREMQVGPFDDGKGDHNNEWHGDETRVYVWDE